MADPRVLAVELRDGELFGVLRGVGVLATLVDLEIAHELALQWAALQHALDRLLQHALGEFALHDLARRLLFDTAGVTGVAVVDLVCVLVARENNLLGVDDDDVVAAVDVRGVDGLVLALEASGDQRRKPANDEAVRVDQDPLLIYLAGLGDEGRHEIALHHVRGGSWLSGVLRARL